MRVEQSGTYLLCSAEILLTYFREIQRLILGHLEGRRVVYSHRGKPDYKNFPVTHVSDMYTISTARAIADRFEVSYF